MSRKPIKIYIAGSLANRQVIDAANRLRKECKFDCVIFDQWHAVGPRIDENVLAYGNERGWTAKQLQMSEIAQLPKDFDEKHIRESDEFVLLCKAGVSGHIELACALWKHKISSHLIFQEGPPTRLDVMVGLFDEDVLVNSLDEYIGILNAKYAQKDEQQALNAKYAQLNEQVSLKCGHQAPISFNYKSQ